MRKLAALVIFALLPFVSLAQPFCPGVTPWVFDDVQASDPFCGVITWMATSNVTLGCSVIDADHRLYCPDGFVTRKQMAAFMKRQADAVMPLTCAPGQVMKWNGAAWTCANDNTGGSGGGGTVTSVLAGTGLLGTPNPIVGAGALNLAPSFQLPQTCGNGQVAKSSGPGGNWTCGNDNAGTGTVTSVAAGAGLTGGTITAAGTLAVDTNAIQSRVTGTCAAGLSIRAIAANGTVTCEADDAGPANAFVQNGNSFGATAVLGTIDNNALELRVNAWRAMRYEPNAISPNIVGGNLGNGATVGVRGATIGGGGVQEGVNDPDYGTGHTNRVTDHYGTVAGGYGNTAGDGIGTVADRGFATVGGGQNNTARGLQSTVGGGHGNTASGLESVIGGGTGNTASGGISTVGGGQNNTVSNYFGAIGGGSINSVQGQYGTVGGGTSNGAIGDMGTIGGGASNTVNGSIGTIGGGYGNAASGNGSTIGGGFGNTAGGPGSTIGGGGTDGNAEAGNTAQAPASAIGGGLGNAIAFDGTYGTVGGGRNNQITAPPGTNLAIATIGGGRDNTVTRGGATIAGGNGNSASGFDATIGGGNANQAGGNQGTVPGGQLNAATGDFSFAAGRRAKSANRGCFTWGDSTDADVLCNVNDRFVARASGGVYLYTAPGVAVGAYLAAGSGTWANLSDRNAKANVEPVDVHAVLARVAALPISTWNYKTQASGIRHLGPMAQDFHAAFGLGDGETTIATVDADGVALAAIQGLNAKLETQLAERDSEIRALRQEVAHLRAMQGDVAALKAAMALLMRERGDSPAMVRTSN